MSWGNKILVAFIGFACLIGLLVYSCMQQNFELVSKDYYKDEIAYQQWIDGSRNANKLSGVQINQTTQGVAIKLPEEQNGMSVTGDVWFYAANRAANDRRMPLLVDENGLMIITKDSLAKTAYQVKINWKANDKQFYNTQNLAVR